MGRVIGTCKRIWSPRGRYLASAGEVLEMLGVKRLPVEGMPVRVIQGIPVYVRALRAKSGPFRNWDGLRVMAICECGRHVPVGRLGQHKCGPLVKRAGCANMGE